MNGRFSRYQVARWIDTLEDRTLYMSLFTSDPFSLANPLAAELIGPSVVRQQSIWERESPFALRLANDVFFSAIPQETTIVAIGAFDKEVNGNLLFRDLISRNGRTPSPEIYSAGGSYVIPAGEMVLGIDVPD